MYCRRPYLRNRPRVRQYDCELILSGHLDDLLFVAASLCHDLGPSIQAIPMAGSMTSSLRRQLRKSKRKREPYRRHD